MTGEPPGILLTSVPPGPSDFERGAVARLGDHERRIARLESVPSGPSLGEFFGMYRGLYMLRGLWHPGTSVTETPAVIDASGQSRTLTYNGNPTFNLHNSVMPYIDFDGTGDYLSRADEAGLDILGTEAYVAAGLKGLTFGGWFWFDVFGSDRPMMSKFNVTLNQRGYVLAYDNGLGAYVCVISGTGADTFVAQSTVTPATGVWVFVVGRFVPGTSVDIFVNGTKNTNTTTIPAAIFNNNAALGIGMTSAAALVLDGHCAAAFLCAAALPDATLNYLFTRSRVLFGV